MVERGDQAGGVIVRVAFGVLATFCVLARLIAAPNCHANLTSFAPCGCSHNRARACTSMSDLSRMRDAAGRRLFGRGVIPRRNAARRPADDRIAPAEMIGGDHPEDPLVRGTLLAGWWPFRRFGFDWDALVERAGEYRPDVRRVETHGANAHRRAMVELVTYAYQVPRSVMCDRFAVRGRRDAEYIAVFDNFVLHQRGGRSDLAIVEFLVSSVLLRDLPSYRDDCNPSPAGAPPLTAMRAPEAGDRANHRLEMLALRRGRVLSFDDWSVLSVMRGVSPLKRQTTISSLLRDGIRGGVGALTTIPPVEVKWMPPEGISIPPPRCFHFFGGVMNFLRNSRPDQSDRAGDAERRVRDAEREERWVLWARLELAVGVLYGIALEVRMNQRVPVYDAPYLSSMRSSIPPDVMETRMCGRLDMSLSDALSWAWDASRSDRQRWVSVHHFLAEEPTWYVPTASVLRSAGVVSAIDSGQAWRIAETSDAPGDLPGRSGDAPGEPGVQGGNGPGAQTVRRAALGLRSLPMASASPSAMSGVTVTAGPSGATAPETGSRTGEGHGGSGGGGDDNRGGESGTRDNSNRREGCAARVPGADGKDRAGDEVGRAGGVGVTTAAPEGPSEGAGVKVRSNTRRARDDGDGARGAREEERATRAVDGGEDPKGAADESSDVGVASERGDRQGVLIGDSDGSDPLPGKSVGLPDRSGVPVGAVTEEARASERAPVLRASPRARGAKRRCLRAHRGHYHWQLSRVRLLWLRHRLGGPVKWWWKGGKTRAHATSQASARARTSYRRRPAAPWCGWIRHR